VTFEAPIWFQLSAVLGISVSVTVTVYGLLSGLGALWDTRRARVKKAERALTVAQDEVEELRRKVKRQAVEIERLKGMRDLERRSRMHLT
jgi:hypothetical protein